MLRHLFLTTVTFITVAAQEPQARPWNQDVIYFALTDRFSDGDPANNIPAGSDATLYDARQRNITKYHGGDFRGLEKAIASGYFEKLGVTALWITPPVRNVWYSLTDLGGPNTGYHGYWAQDFLDVDPHIVSRKSLDGTTEYPDTRDGRMQHYKDLVSLAHRHGMKVIQDIVCNHAGPVFYYDVNHNKSLDREDPQEWMRPFRKEGPYENTEWINIPEWNAVPAQPGGPQTILGRVVKTTGTLQKFSTYGRHGMSSDSLGKRDGEEVTCDFFALRDIDTDPKSPHFNPLVDDFVEIYRFYLEEIGIDGFRIDTVKHVHRGFWEAFTERLRAAAGPERAKRMLMFGEIYDSSPSVAGRYTFREQWPARKDPCLDSVLSFDFCFAARQYLRRSNDGYGSPFTLENALKSPGGKFYNPTPGLDGLNARQKMVNFVENHDGLNRFRAWKISERTNTLANALVLLVEGIPCLYYGSEAALHDEDGKLLTDGETGRLTFLRADEPERLKTAQESASFATTAMFVKLRRELPALTVGETWPLWVDSGDSPKDDGIFAFARATEKSAVIMVFNAAKATSITGLPGAPMQVMAGNRPLLSKSSTLKLEAVFPAEATPTTAITWKGTKPLVEVTMQPRSVAVFSVQ